MTTYEKPYAIIGAGPSGLAGARNLQRLNIPFVGFESHSDVGGLWDIENPKSTVYESAHLISSKKMTEFTEYPMPEDVAVYPSHRALLAYFRGFAKEFGLYEHFQFSTAVEKIMPENGLWRIKDSKGNSALYSGVLIANGILSEPNMPNLTGHFNGEMLHSAKYKSADIFAGKRVLIVGAGNSGCDIAVDAVHRAESVTMSLRRGYHFVPKFILGRPADTIGGLFNLPANIKQAIDGRLLKLFTGDPEKYGFPKPDHKIYESHPIVNSLVLHYAGHGDIAVKPDIERVENETVYFVDDSQQEFDLIVLATGYKLHYPFIEREHLNWQGSIPRLYLNCFHPDYHNIFILGLVEAAGIGWQGRYEQAALVAEYIRAMHYQSPAAVNFNKMKKDVSAKLDGGFNYMDIDRMAYYVHKDTYLKKLRQHIARFKSAAKSLQPHD